MASDRTVSSSTPARDTSAGATSAGDALTGTIGALPPFWNGFRRITTSGTTIPAIDGLRLVAIVAVLAYHVGEIIFKHVPLQRQGSLGAQLWWTFVGKGYLGVDLFFMISGFVLALPFARHHLQQGPKPGLRRYYLRRLTRLEPPYLLTLLLFFLILLVSGAHSARGLLFHLLASVFYLHNLVYGKNSLINPSAWSLEVEVQFYLLAPLLAGVFARPSSRRRPLLAAAVVAGSLLSWALAASNQPHLPLLLLHLPHFAAGFLLAEIYLTGGPPFPAAGRQQWLALALVLLALAATAWLNWAGLYFVVLPWLFLGLGLAALYHPAVNRALSRGVVPILGGMVYSIYLVHAQIISAVTQLLVHHHVTSGHFLRDYTVVAALSLPVCAVCSALLFRAVERPCMNPRWVQELWDRLGGGRGGRRSARM